MIVKVLVENSSSQNICGEHGLSFYVEYKSKRYLIDTGASSLFALNADKMGIDLSKIDMAFLSHAHYDHSGGYEKFFELNNKAKVYLQKSAKNEYYKIAPNIKKYIGIPKGVLDRYDDRFTYLNGMTKIDEGIYVITHYKSKVLERAKETHMCVVINNEVLYDDFSHEQIIIFEEDDGLICFNSCSHSGVDVAVEEVKETFKNKKIKAYFGGFHMMGLAGIDSTCYEERAIKEVGKKILEMTEAKFYSGHCTGNIAYSFLSDVLGDRIEKLYTGKEIKL